jgi:Tfp pilus assembly protein PilV
MCKAERTSGERWLPPRDARQRGYRRGVTLLESLMASGILLVAVVAVCSAVTAGQHHAFEANSQIAGVMAAEEWLGRLQTVSYSELITDWNGRTEFPGQMRTIDNRPFPDSFHNVGRTVNVQPATVALNGLGVEIHGMTVAVSATDRTGRTMLTLRRFIAQPSNVTIPESSDGDGDGGGLIGGLGGLLGL